MSEKINHPKSDLVNHADRNMTDIYQRKSAEGKRIPLKDMQNGAFGNKCSEGYRVGLLTYCNASVAFISREYADSFSKEREAVYEAESVMFFPGQARFMPENAEIQTYRNFYVVKYMPGGKIKNRKTGLEQKTIDYNYPIEVLKTIDRKRCNHACISDDALIYTEKKERIKPCDFSGENTDPLQKERKDTDYSVFDRLFADGNYAEILSSEILERTAFCDLPVNYMEMVLTCAARLLFPSERRTVSLNLFQREVIASPNAYSFIKKWKIDGKFSDALIFACAESSIADFSFPTDFMNVVRLINRVGYTNARNRSYTGLTGMFAVCHDSILPYLFLVRAYAQRKRLTLATCIAEYCQIVKNIKKSSENPKISEENKCLFLTEYIKAVYRLGLVETELPQNIKTMIASVYMDIHQFDVFSELMQYLDPQNTSIDARVVRLYENIDVCRESDIKEILAGNVNLQMFQKCIALAWERYDIGEALPLQFLQVLSWICMSCDSTMIDEILRYHFSPCWNRDNKQTQLIISYPEVCRAAADNTSMYAMAAYIRYFVYTAIPDVYKLPDEINAQFARWDEFSQNTVHSAISAYTPITAENAPEFVKLFGIFSLDDACQTLLQGEYAEWYQSRCNLNERSEKEICTILDALFSQRAYETFIEIYTRFSEMSVSGEFIVVQIGHYVDALLALRRFPEAIDVLQRNYEINYEISDRLLIKAVTENFRYYGISSGAYAVFGNHFTCDNAISLLENNIYPNQMYIFTDLLALYCYKNEYLKALYLYVTYQEKAEKGFTRLYSQFRVKIKNVSGKLHNHNDVIRLAFYTLDICALIEFLEWTNRIPLPTYRGYNSVHVFAYYYDKIRAYPKGPALWEEFMTRLSMHADVDFWDIIVCESAVRLLDGGEVPSSMGTAIENVIRKTETADLPFNFLPYCFTYLMEHKDSGLCKEITSFISRRDIAEKLFGQNLWRDGYSAAADKFKSFCVEEYGKTGDAAYYDILAAIGTDLDEKQMSVIAQEAGCKGSLFAQICRNYLNGEKKAEMLNIIRKIDRADLSRQETAFFDVIRILYEEDHHLFEENSRLFKNEESVGRFKHDAAAILSTYPEKKGLLSFEESCADEMHKLIVYSYVLDILYDEEIKERKPVPFRQIIRDDTFYYAFLSFYAGLCRSQLDWNAGYPSFYKKWRYLKMYIAGFLLGDGKYDENEIVSEMLSNGHYESFYDSAFVPFRDDVTEFRSIGELDSESKKEFLLSLMSGRFGEFLQDHTDEVRGLPQIRKRLLERLIGQIDYRDANLSFYQVFIGDFGDRIFTAAIETAEAISGYAYDAVMALKNASDKTEAVKLLKDTALIVSPSGVVRKILSVDDTVLEKYPTLLMAVLCSRQLNFHAYGAIRSTILQNSQKVSWVLLNKLAEYLTSKNTDDAAIAVYLTALKACLENNREILSQTVLSHDITRGIPSQWNREAGRILDFAAGKIAQFMPDITIWDNGEIV